MYWHGYYGPDFFWLFIIVIVVVSAISRVIRGNQRERTIRAAIEKGVALDPATLSSLNSRSVSSPQDTRAGLLTGSIVTFFVGCGLMVLGFVAAADHPHAFHPLIGVGGLMWCISLGLFVARFAVGRG